jgi:hypothetical protein
MGARVIDPAIIAAFRAAGASSDMIVAAIEAYAAEQKAAKQEANRQKVARWRAEQKAKQNNDHVTQVTVTPVTEVTEFTGSAPISRENITTRAPAVIPVGLSNDNPPKDIPPLAPQAEPAAPRAAKRAKPRSSMTADYQPAQADHDTAAEAGMSNEEFRIEWRKFRDHHMAVGSLMADWPAAWRKWVGNWQSFGKARAGPGMQQRRSNEFASHGNTIRR